TSTYSARAIAANMHLRDSQIANQTLTIRKRPPYRVFMTSQPIPKRLVWMCAWVALHATLLSCTASPELAAKDGARGASFSPHDSATSDPGWARPLAQVSWGSPRMDVFYRGQDDALWWNWTTDGVTWNTQSLGGQITSDPAAVTWGTGRIDVFARA